MKLEYWVAIVIGCCLGAYLYRKCRPASSSLLESDEALRYSFGEPMCTTCLSLAEIKDWLKLRQPILAQGGKAVIAKATRENLKNIEKYADLNSLNNYVIVSVIDHNNDIKDKMLIKYERLEENLEKMLAKDNGAVVVEA